MSHSGLPFVVNLSLRLHVLVSTHHSFWSTLECGIKNVRSTTKHCVVEIIKFAMFFYSKICPIWGILLRRIWCQIYSTSSINCCLKIIDVLFITMHVQSIRKKNFVDIVLQIICDKLGSPLSRNNSSSSTAIC